MTLREGTEPLNVRAPEVALALLNYNGWRDTLACLESVESLQYPAPDVYLCDNSSTNDSVVQIEQWARARRWSYKIVQHAEPSPEHEVPGSPRLLVIRNAENSGFARGSNIAIRWALASCKRYQYVWVLNTDTEVAPESLARAVSVGEAHPEAGSVQSLLVCLRRPDTVDSAGLRLLRRGGAIDAFHLQPLSRFEAHAAGRDAVPIFGACAAAALYRSDLLSSLGAFDESLWSMSEDVELACRLRAAGYKCFLAAYSIVWHIGGESRGRKTGYTLWRARRNRMRVVARWYPRPLGAVILAVNLVRLLLVSVTSRFVTLSEWVRVTRLLLGEFMHGADSRTRRSVVAPTER